MTHDEFIYGMNAAYSEFITKNSMSLLLGKKLPIITEQNERLATILMDVINDHKSTGNNMFIPDDYSKASHKLNVICNSAYGFDFNSVPLWE